MAEIDRPGALSQASQIRAFSPAFEPGTILALLRTLGPEPQAALVQAAFRAMRGRRKVLSRRVHFERLIEQKAEQLRAFTGRNHERHPAKPGMAQPQNAAILGRVREPRGIAHGRTMLRRFHRERGLRRSAARGCLGNEQIEFICRKAADIEFLVHLRLPARRVSVMLVVGALRVFTNPDAFYPGLQTSAKTPIA